MVIDQEKSAVARELAGTAHALSVAVDHELLSQVTAMEVLAADISLDHGNLGGFQNRADREIGADRNWLNIGLIDPVTHRIIVASPHLTSAPTSISPAHVDQVVRSRKPVIVGAFAGSKITRGPMILLMTPVMRAGLVRYVLGVAMSPKSIGDVFLRQALSPLRTGSILDDRLMLAGRSRNPERYLGSRATPTLCERIAARQSGMFTALNREGIPYCTVFSRSKETGWTVAIGVPASEVEGPIRRKIVQLSFAGGLLMAFALLVTGTVGRGIVRRHRFYELSLKERESRFRVLADSAPVFIWLADTDKLCTWVNRARLDFSGRTLEEELGSGWAQGIHPEDFDRCYLSFADAFDNRRPFTTHFRFRRGDGEYRWIQDTGIPRYEEGTFKGFIGSGTDVTERMEAQAALKSALVEYQFILDNAPVGISKVVDRKQVWVNRKTEEIFRYQKEDLESQTTRKLYPSDHAYQALGLEAYPVLARGQVFETEQELVRSDGAKVFVRYLGKDIDPPDPSRGTLWILEDITERKRVEAELRESEERFHTVFDQAAVGIARVDTGGHFVEVNRKLCDILGFTTDELLAMTFQEITHPDDLPRDLVQVGKMMAGEISSYSIEKRYRHKSGRFVWGSLTLTLTRQADHTPKYCIAVVEDIQKRKEVEGLLQQSEERYRTVVQDQTECIVRFTADGTYLFVNDVFCRIFGKTREDLQGKLWFPDALPEDLPDVEGLLATLSPSKPVVVIENRVHTGSGGARWMQFVNRGFFDVGGRLLEIQAVGRDITERKQAEDALVDARNHLELQVQERTASLSTANRQLLKEIEERKLIEREIRDHQQKIQAMSLELSMAEARERDRIAGELHDQVGQRLILGKMKLDALASRLACDRAESEAQEINRLLDQSIQDIRSLTFQLRPPILANAGLEAAVEWLGEEFRADLGLQMVFSCDQQPKPLKYEVRSTVFQAVRELLLNVAKHAGSDRVEVRMLREGDCLVIEVEDDGVGIDSAADRDRKARGGGFGLFNLGQRMEYLGGSFRIESAPGKGTRATILVPLEQAAS